ncbi:glycosyltransferase [Acinetobacter sp. 3657]|uniref:glycosyltransferase n=1 Tax=Acinetobacter sp. 3657 TaxID=2817764 RepID=UPI0028666CBB|nr:hypothetical protein [Prolinoborus sp. 3657]
MKNVLYFSYSDDLSDKFSGVSKKIYAQTKAIEQLNCNVLLAGNIGGLYGIVGDTERVNLRAQSLLTKKKIMFNFLIKKIKQRNIDVVYIRMIGASPRFISFLRLVKSLNVKIIMEIPTYPYDQEAKSFKGKVYNFLDRIYRKQYKGLIDYIVTFSDDDFIYDVKCINISNAVSEDSIQKNIPVKNTGILKFISVSSLYYWHGVDRFVDSIEHHINHDNNNFPFKFYIVGPNNEEMRKIRKKLEVNNKLNQFVEYLGFKNSQELNEIYKDTHIGVGSLGRHRSNIFKINTLKNKEYCANGLPIIYSENDRDLDGKSFVYKVPADESNIDINSICEWYINRCWNDSDITDFIINYTWFSQMKKVFKTISGGGL